MAYIECGNAPKSIGYFETPSKEMMFYLHLPIRIPGTGYAIPERLVPFRPMVEAAWTDMGGWAGLHCYLTVKTMYVSKECPGNRPGWHIDGFGSGGDVNYIWASCNPTEFAVQEFNDVSPDDRQSMIDIERQIDASKIKKWPDKMLLRLDEKVVHRASPEVSNCVRTFVKITFSEHQFRNEGNSRNYLLDYVWNEKPRNMERNIDHG